MEIAYFSRLKSFRKSGRLSVILKLTLPELRRDLDETDLGRIDAFNSFYISLAETYQTAAGKIEVDESVLAQRPLMLNVGFEEITGDYLSKNAKLIKKCCEPVVIKRYVRKNRNGEITVRENVDVFDLKHGIFIK